MKGVRYSGIYFTLMIIIQIIICNICLISPLLTISILPAVVFCLKTDMKPYIAMIIAFVIGLLTDLTGDGVIGLNALALVPVAAARPYLLVLFFGKETVERGENFSFKKNGITSILLVTICLYTLFLMIYIGADGAGTRPVIFNCQRYLLSLGVNLLPALLCIHMLTYQERN